MAGSGICWKQSSEERPVTMSMDDLAAVVTLLDDQTARRVLKETSLAARSANELAQRCEASQQTVYRRLEQLEEAGLVTDQTRVREDGHHDTVYRATLDTISIRLHDGELEFDITRRETKPADQLTDLWRNF